MFRYVVVCSTYEACQTNNNQNATGCLNKKVYQYINNIVGLLKGLHKSIKRGGK